MDHTDKFIGYELRVSLVLKVEEFRNREDSHGGPGFYPAERVLAYKTKIIPYTLVSQYLDIRENCI